MSKVNLTISVDNKDKDSFNDLVSELGLNVSSAINMFIKQSIRNQALPLNLALNQTNLETSSNLEEIAGNIMNKYDEAFKELAKWSISI